MLFWGGMTVKMMFSGEGNAEELKMLIFCPHSCEPSTKMQSSLTTSLFPWFFFAQVLGNWSPVFLPGDSAHPVREHPGPGAQAAALLSELRGDHAQRGRRCKDWDPGMPAPVSREKVELHHRQRQLSHLWACAG